MIVASIIIVLWFAAWYAFVLWLVWPMISTMTDEEYQAWQTLQMMHPHLNPWNNIYGL